jgi:hypothetical protein
MIVAGHSATFAVVVEQLAMNTACLLALPGPEAAVDRQAKNCP